MKPTNAELWQRFQKHYTEFPSIELALDLSRINFKEGFFESMDARIQRAFAEMADLEKGSIANPDEGRMVGHYWLRNPDLAPNSEIASEIEATLKSIESFAAEVHGGKIPGQGGKFKNFLVIGIGGSALGPQFVANALGCPKQDKLKPYFFDNTDPDGMDRVLAQLEGELGQTLVIVISKSGSTKETRNGMIEAECAYSAAKLDFSRHAVAVTGNCSELDKHAEANGWIKRFPMWDWVGGRTSELSAVGLLPAMLQGVDIKGLINGARVCDEATRIPNVKTNPAAQLALSWFSVGNGKGDKDMVVLPYKDRLELLSKYLQQLIMESLGKEKDKSGKIVNQGIAVFGNKGSTDQHSYIQQLRDGINNFFATFIQVLEDRANDSIFVEDGVTTGDYLNGFFMGTRQALYENGRQSLTITIKSVTPFSVGVLIALFERAVGYYASFVDINAYHQPGVEAGKKAAGKIIAYQKRIMECLQSNSGKPLSLTEIASRIEAMDEIESVFKICQHLSSSKQSKVQLISGSTPFDAKYLA